MVVVRPYQGLAEYETGKRSTAANPRNGDILISGSPGQHLQYSAGENDQAHRQLVVDVSPRSRRTRE